MFFFLSKLTNQQKESLIKPQKPPEMQEYLGEEDEEEMEEEEDPQLIIDQIKELEMMMEKGVENISDDYIIGQMRYFLSQNLCQNRGYVIDGYPVVTAQVISILTIFSVN